MLDTLQITLLVIIGVLFIPGSIAVALIYCCCCKDACGLRSERDYKKIAVRRKNSVETPPAEFGAELLPVEQSEDK